MFKTRSTEKELLDQDGIPASDLYQNLRELDFINHWLGGYSISFSAIKKVSKTDKTYVFADIGCGGGDTLKRVLNWNKRAGFQLDMYGIDIKPVCIDYAKQNLHGKRVNLICDDYRNLFKHVEKVDIIHACLFCHHLTEQQLTELIHFAVRHRATLIINDLERHPIAYYSIKWLTRLFSKSYLVKNDAPRSVLRGFKKKEWIEMIQRAAVKTFSVRNKWAFRHEIIIYGSEGTSL
jgi:2-polyprenyl-3-methyl-5-hydroxy-6-metoxy-1,4-benzoquinol methylase